MKIQLDIPPRPAQPSFGETGTITKKSLARQLPGRQVAGRMNTPNASTVTLLVLIPLFAWRIYTRFRRQVGRQRLSRIRPRITLVIYTTLLALLGFAAHAHPQLLGWLAGGVSLGSLLGIFGLSKTQFEPTPKGLFYTPNVHLGIALSVLFVARLAYRLFEVYAIKPTEPHGMDDFVHSHLTLAVFGLLAGYYLTYAIGLIRWRFRVLRAKRRREALKLENEGSAARRPD